jgi:hypothetical protein
MVVILLATLASGADAQREFAGLKFGVGISMTFDTGENKRVEAASVDANGIVRVDQVLDTPARIMLESHYFFQLKNNDKAGLGPFMALQPGSDEIINALGLGLMLGFRRDTTSQSFNLGLGYAVDPRSKILGEEFIEGELAPKAPDGTAIPVRYKTTQQGGLLLLFSFSW